jgi:hypothetical protein
MAVHDRPIEARSVTAPESVLRLANDEADSAQHNQQESAPPRTVGLAPVSVTAPQSPVAEFDHVRLAGATLHDRRTAVGSGPHRRRTAISVDGHCARSVICSVDQGWQAEADASDRCNSVAMLGLAVALLHVVEHPTAHAGPLRELVEGPAQVEPGPTTIFGPGRCRR